MGHVCVKVESINASNYHGLRRIILTPRPPTQTSTKPAQMVDARQPAKRLVPWREAAAAAAAEKAAAAGANNNKASFPLTRKQALAMLHAPTQVRFVFGGVGTRSLTHT